jgi:hypothetical protein
MPSVFLVFNVGGKAASPRIFAFTTKANRGQVCGAAVAYRGRDVHDPLGPAGIKNMAAGPGMP